LSVRVPHAAGKPPAWSLALAIPVTTETASHPRARAANGLPWRRPALLIGLLGLVVVLTLNWSWLVASGAIVVLFGVLPCIAMCVLQLCSRRKLETRRDE
jgi:hypothetical protein